MTTPFSAFEDLENTPKYQDELLQDAVRKLKAGATDERASEYVVRTFRSRLIAYFKNHNFSAEDAEDLVQETFRRVFSGMQGLRDEARFVGWLFQIARNVRLTAQTSMAPVMWVSVDEVDVPNPKAERTDRTEKLDRAWDLIEKLPPQQKQCLLMRVVHEMSYEEIARVLKLSSRTVRNHLREARLRLRLEIEDV